MESNPPALPDLPSFDDPEPAGGGAAQTFATTVASAFFGGTPVEEHYGLKSTELARLAELAEDGPAPDVTPEEALERSGYGAPPEAPWLWPIYSVGVFRTRRERADVVTTADGLRADALAKARAKLQALGQGCFARRAKPELARLKPELAKLAELATVAAEREEVQAVAQELGEQGLAELERALEQAREVAAPAVQASKRADAAHERATTDVRRAEAMLKRAEIETRAAVKAGQVSDARLAELEGRRDERQRELEQAMSHRDAQQATRDEARAALDLAMAPVREAEAKRDAARQALTERQEGYRGEVEQACAEQRSAERALASAALQAGLIEEGAAREALAALSELEHCQHEHAVLAAALHAYDPATYQRGLIAMGAAAAVFVGALGWLIVG